MRALGVIALVLAFELLILVKTMPARQPNCESNRMLILWNAFASEANQYVSTLDTDKERRARDRERLNQKWQQVMADACF